MAVLKNKLINKIKIVGSALLLTSLISACGFHLRGAHILPEELQTLRISSQDKFGELTRVVKQHLAYNNVNVVKASTTKTPELRILKDKLDRRTLSVFPNGQVAEYELIYSVRYQIIIENEEPQNFEFELYRDYQDDPNLALAKSRELNLLLSEMRQVAADRILRDMASFQI